MIHKSVSLHHETIYRFVYTDKAVRGELYKQLRIASKPYYKRYGSNYSKRGRIPNRVSIHDRPKIIDDKMRTGDIEGNTIIGKDKQKQGALLTLVDGKTLYTEIVKFDGKHADKLAQAAIERLKSIRYRLHSLPLITA